MDQLGLQTAATLGFAGIAGQLFQTSLNQGRK
jgi:hypothetical protein